LTPIDVEDDRPGFTSVDDAIRETTKSLATGTGRGVGPEQRSVADSGGRQLATVSNRLALAGSSLIRRASGPRSRTYCRGEQPMTLLKAVLKALSDSYPSDGAIMKIESLEFVSRSLT